MAKTNESLVWFSITANSKWQGTLENGHEIAVKRLSSGSGQGLKEFRNEINSQTSTL